jgi:hypothetical protein
MSCYNWRRSICCAIDGRRADRAAMPQHPWAYAGRFPDNRRDAPMTPPIEPPVSQGGRRGRDQEGRDSGRIAPQLRDPLCEGGTDSGAIQACSKQRRTVRQHPIKSTEMQSRERPNLLQQTVLKLESLRVIVEPARRKGSRSTGLMGLVQFPSRRAESGSYCHTETKKRTMGLTP